ncbi:APC family permease [Agrobacterium sp. rho-8.1]|nr:APC family permease [Agrobacterium sp. rho-8.1]
MFAGPKICEIKYIENLIVSTKRCDIWLVIMALVRNLTSRNGTAIAISMVIGSGLFGLPGLVISETDAVTALFSWVVVALCIAPTIHIFSELGYRLASSEGVAGFATYAVGNWSRGGFTLIACGALAVGMPAFFLVIGAYASELLNLDPTTWRGPIAIAVAWFATLMNLRGVHNLAVVNQLIVISVLVIMTGIVVLSLSNLGIASQTLTREVMNYTPNINSLWAGCVIVFWAFQGWENLSFGLEEVRDPEKTIPRIYWFSFVIVVILYLAFAWVVSASVYAGVDVTGVSGLSALLGTGTVRTVLLFTMVVVLIANANSWVFGASRAFYAAGNLALLPRSLGRTDDKGTPVVSLLSAATIYTLFIGLIEISGTSPSTAFMLTTQGFIILLGFSILAYLKFKRRVPGAWFIGALAMIGWIFLVHGFSLLLLYPISLFAIGCIRQSMTVLKSP